MGPVAPVNPPCYAVSTIFETPTSGKIWVDGKLWSKKAKEINAMRREIGMVFQQFNLFPHLTALENITVAQKVGSQAKKMRRQ